MKDRGRGGGPLRTLMLMRIYRLLSELWSLSHPVPADILFNGGTYPADFLTQLNGKKDAAARALLIVETYFTPLECV
jgi:hypothetical protein